MTMHGETIATGAEPRCEDCGRLPHLDVYRSGAGFYVGTYCGVRGVLAVADTVKDNAAAIVEDLRGMGIQVAMITGDNVRTGESISRELGIDRVLAEVLPEDKVNEVRRLQDEGRDRGHGG
jgi:cation-transporting ATPase V